MSFTPEDLKAAQLQLMNARALRSKPPVRFETVGGWVRFYDCDGGMTMMIHE